MGLDRSCLRVCWDDLEPMRSVIMSSGFGGPELAAELCHSILGDQEGIGEEESCASIQIGIRDFRLVAFKASGDHEHRAIRQLDRLGEGANQLS